MMNVNPRTQSPGLDVPLTGETELSAILDMSAAGICRVMDRKMIWVNATMSRMLGYAAKELVGKNTRMLYLSDDEYRRVGGVLYNGVEKFGTGIAETRLKHRDNRAVDCRIRASRLDNTEPDRGEVIVITDISELKLLQVQLQQAQKMEAIGVLAGGVSHDFNNILMAIQGHLSLMQIDLKAHNKVEKHVFHIGKLVKAASELTARLLGFARGGKYRVGIVDMNELVSGCLDKFTATREVLSVIKTLAPDLKQVDADTSQIKHVMFNLFLNADQAMTGSDRQLKVTSRNVVVHEDNPYHFNVRPGDYVQVTVEDNGSGMEEKVVKRVFDPFFSTRQIDDKKGTGLGLSTVFGIIKNHNGYITIDSQPGRGSAFHIHLPARKTG